jgi:hypothetical protein
VHPHEGTAEVVVACDEICVQSLGGCTCEPKVTRCEGSQLRQCSADGMLSVSTCALGCAADGDRCVDVDPSNGLAPFLDMADEGPDLVIPDDASIASVSGEIKVGSNVIAAPSALVKGAAGGVDIRVFWVRSLRVGNVLATGGPGVAFVSAGEVVFDGHLRVRAGGGFPMGSGSTGQCEGEDDCAGSGGGGFGSAGGRGGDSASNTGAQGGGVSGSVEIEPLRGGANGGLGDDRCTSAVCSPCKGLGGGAIQIVSRSKVSIAAGAVDAGGQGSSPDPLPIDRNVLACGGGSGGGILLEAPRIEVGFGAAVVANGGGGAGGCSIQGEDGRLSDQRAPGGLCASLGDGGAGAAVVFRRSTGRVTPSPRAPAAAGPAGSGSTPRPGGSSSTVAR